MELAGPAPLCIENPKGQAQAKDKTGLCLTQTLEHSWEAQDDAWAAVPPGALWVCVSHGWPYCLGTGLAVALENGPICLLEFRKLLQTNQQIGKCLKSEFR